MHDINKIREDKEKFFEGWKRRGLSINLNEILEIDKELRLNISKIQDFQERRNKISKDAGKAKSDKEESLFLKLNKESQSIKNSISELEDKKYKLDLKLKEILSSLPNLPSMELPEGEDESSNIEIRKEGKIINENSPPHFELGEKIKEIDFETASEISGSRFVIASGSIAKLERGLSNFMLDIHSKEHGYQEVNVC